MQPKYAHPERERRFVLAAVPPGASDPREILDHYVIGTRLRLRSVTTPNDRVHKLGQKIRPDPGDPELVMHTSVYLSRDEYEVLAGLPAQQLHKTRRRVDVAGGAMSVDQFHDVLEGLITAEIDCATEVMLREFEPPAFCIAEVSRDERFTGGQLAMVSRAALVRNLEVVSGLRLPS